MSLYFVPANRQNLELSIEQDVPPERLAPFVPDDVIREIQDRAGMEGIRCWAMTPTKRSIFDAMHPGDIVLMSEKGTRRFTHCAQVTFKLESKALGDDLWPIRGEKSWELIYFLRNIRRVSIPKAEFVIRFGYQPNFDVAGATLVSTERVRDFEARHGPIEDWFDLPYFREELPEDRVELHDEVISDYSADNVAVVTKRRRLHAKFAAKIKANYGAACAMCGITEQDFLVAGHIVAWSEDEKNRLNPANGLCLCVLHDRAFERGYLIIDDGFHIRMNRHIHPDSPLGNQLKQLDGLRLRLPVSHPPDLELLKRHRDKFPLWSG
ncbi:HNH endonuclease [Hyalangium gracile]|uniref:HNH endonuclease n=1 Tax=Hyalangium gracile TaxID=394092 RepID=UPI001CC9D837|nr:HNH endonuclease [Hyalangium gracile]